MFVRSTVVALLVSVAALASSQAADSRLEFQQGDSMHSVLLRQAGQVVEIRLKSGEKLGGKIEKVGEKLVHLSQLTGAEFYEAVVAVEEISAVIIRAKK